MLVHSCALLGGSIVGQSLRRPAAV